MSRREVALVSALLSLVSAVAVAMIVIDATTSLRAPLVLGAMVSAPGWAILCWLKTIEWPVAWTTAVGASTSIIILVSMGLLATDLWYPRAATGLLLSVACLTLGVRAIQHVRLELLAARSWTPKVRR